MKTPLFNKLTIVAVFCALSIFLSFPSKSAADYRAHVCSNTTTYTPNSTYQSNLNLLLSSLTSNATRSGGFYNTSIGGRVPGTDDEVAYGSIMCRGDLTPQQCQTCAASAAKELVETLCPVEKVAIVWFDECMMRYSNESFFGVMSESPGYYLWNPQNVSDPEGTFSQLVGDTMRDVAASAMNSNSRFAVLSRNFSDFQSLYSTAQCTPDISSIDCNICLSNAVGRLPNCCTWRQGGRVLFPSCNVRFELYPFYNETAPASPNTSPPPPPSLPPPPLSPQSSNGSGGNGNISATTLVAICVPIVVALLLISICFCYLKKKRKGEYNAVRNDQNGVNEITTVESLQYDLGTIQAATNNFSDDNKLGEGGFGAVYKGTLSDGQEIAVKRLSTSSLQGVGEFKNEVVLVAKLQHRNLTRLLGFCLEGEEKLLVYEFVPNKSLDQFLFDYGSDQEPLDWSKRYKIIGGVARGLLYLHEDSRLRIIHRDMKASNILLDGQMNAKISDFGLAKICGVDQTQGNTSRIVGTYGYMAPEYAFYGQFSVKSDVFSFGTLIIEIITGKKCTNFSDSESDAPDLLSFTWKHWTDRTPLELLDPRLRDSYTANEVARCIHIGLLCVQEDPADRPTMATVVLMLSSFSVSLPLPKQPAYFPHTRTLESMPPLEAESDKSSSKSYTINEMSISDMYPR